MCNVTSMDKSTSSRKKSKKNEKFKLWTAPRYLPGSVHNAVIQADLKEYNKHRYKIFTATSKLDTSPVHFCTDKYIRPMRVQADMYALRFIDNSNKKLLQKINKINRSKGYVDSHNPAAYKNLSKWSTKEQELNSIKKDNKKLYKRLMDASSVYSKADYEKDWNNILQKMEHFAKFPLIVREKKTKDDELHEYPSLTSNLSICNKNERPKCFIEFRIDNGLKLGRIIVELYNDIAPITVENFLSICRGENKLTYKNSSVYKIYQDKYLILGAAANITRKRKKLKEPEQFTPEHFGLNYNRPGVLSTISVKDDKNNKIQNQFCITFNPLPELNGKQTIFGKIMKGATGLYKINDLGTKYGRPVVKIIVTDCGQLPDKSK